MLLPYFCPALLFSSVVAAQVIPTQQIFDCSNPNFQVIYTACQAGDYSRCCAVGTDCCAGGCCTAASFCVGVGTPKEACCDASDTTLCGTGPARPVPSVVCEGGNGLSSYQCPPDSTCNTYNDTCYLPQSMAAASSTKSALPASSAVMSSAESVSPTGAVSTTVVVTASASSTNSPSLTDVAPTTVVVTASASSSAATREATTTSAGGGSVSVSITTVSSSPSATTAKSSAASYFVNGFILTLPVMSSILVMAWPGLEMHF